MSKGRNLFKKKWKDFRKSPPKPKRMRSMKFPRKTKLLEEVIHIGMGLPKSIRSKKWGYY